MRYCLFCATSVGFLALIALTWGVPATTTDFPSNTRFAALEVLFTADRSPASSSRTSLDEIHRLEACYRSQNCEVPHSSSCSYRCAVSEALAIAIAEHWGNFGANATLARAAVLSPEPIVQAVGLRMLASLPPNGENLSALGNGLRESNNTVLVVGSLRELRRYIGTSLETDAQRIVEQLVGYGGLSGAAQASKLVAPFINEHSYDEFREELSRLDAGAEAAELLRGALAEYQTRRKGG